MTIELNSVCRTTFLAAGLSIWAGSAAAVTITSIYGEWVDPTPEGVTGLNIETTADSTLIEWGLPYSKNENGWYIDPTGEKSGFEAEWSIPPEIDVVPGVDADFEFGLFTHRNNVIDISDPAVSAITSVQLNLTTEFLIETAEYTVNQVFTFLFHETPNFPKGSCAYGGTPNDAFNPRGCRDRVEFVENEGLSQPVIVDGMSYSLDITGFMLGDELASVFLTAERKENQAKLLGRLRVEEIPQTPLPAAGWLMVAGFGALAFASRRRRNA